MNDQKPLNTGSTQKPATHTGASSAPQQQNPSRDSVTFTPNDAFEPAAPTDEKAEDIQDAAHEKVLDIDSELKDADLSKIELKVVQPIVPPRVQKPVMPLPVQTPIQVPPPPQPTTPAPVEPPQVAPTPVVPAPPAAPTPAPAVTSSEKPFVLPGFVPDTHVPTPAAAVTPTPAQTPTLQTPAPLQQEEAISPLRQPRSFASLTPLVMRTPVEPGANIPAPEPSPAVPETPTPVPPMRAPIPIQQEIPGQAPIIPGMVTKQPQAPAKADEPEEETKQQEQTVLEKLREQSASVLHPLRTYQSDARVSIRENNTSLVTAAAAEENRRVSAPILVRPTYKPTVEAPQHHYLRTILLVLGASLFLAGGIGAVAYVLIPKSVDIAGNQAPTEHPIAVDESVELPFAGLSHDQLQQFLTDMRDKTDLSLGLVREIYFTVPLETGGKRLATIEEVLPKLAPHIPPELTRTLSKSFLVGVHVYDGNQGFMILKTDSYEQAFSAMLAWEPTMHDDLLPFMDRRAGPRLQSDTVTTSTPTKVLGGAFVDVVLRNHDTRALYDRFGNLIFLYSFIDRNTIFIGTNEFTLSEAIIRTNAR